MSEFSARQEGMHDLYVLVISIAAIVGIIAIVLFVVLLRAGSSSSTGGAYNTGSAYYSPSRDRPSWGYASGNTYYVGLSDSFVLNKDGSVLVIREPGLSTLTCKCSGNTCGSQCLMTINNNRLSCTGESCELGVLNI